MGLALASHSLAIRLTRGMIQRKAHSNLNVEGEGKNVAYYLHTQLTFKMLSSQKHGQTVIYTTMYRIKILSKLSSYSH